MTFCFQFWPRQFLLTRATQGGEESHSNVRHAKSVGVCVVCASYLTGGPHRHLYPPGTSPHPHPVSVSMTWRVNVRHVYTTASASCKGIFLLP